MSQQNEDEEKKEYAIVYQNDDVIIAMRVRENVGEGEE